jgi:hypothetical protein
LLFVAGPAIYFAEFRLGRFRMPWYVPVLASVGVLLMGVSFWQRRGVWRGIVLALVLVLCGLEWYVSLVLTRTPDYTGPAQANRKVPAFHATLARSSTAQDGQGPAGDVLTDKSLQGQNTILLFFRGRW